MPFGLRLKKTRRYNVSGKNSYVARIKLLDTTQIECTLTNESMGQDCLDTIAQRLQLEETVYFGLQYCNKNYKTRWVDLEKPLKKQLDKNAHPHDPVLKFGVMFYSADVTKLGQEITRYLYFLQLKSDIIEGLLPCSAGQAILLASFAIQAEFGDYEPERHTVKTLQDFVLLPKNLTSDGDILVELIDEVINTYKTHRGMSPDNAEFSYISLTSQQLDGYGQDTYPSKDEKGNELLLGTSCTGIFVKHLDSQPTKHYKWSDIQNMVHNKRLLGFEFSRHDETVQFQMDDADTAKYVWRMCRTQCHFYRMIQDNILPSGQEIIFRPGGQEVLIDGVGYENHLPESNGPYRTTIERRPTLLRHSELSEQLNNKRELSSDESLHQGVQVDGHFNQSQLSLEQHPTQDMIGQYTTSQLSLDRAATMDHRAIFANGNVILTDANGSVYSAPSVNSLNHGIAAQVSPTSSNPSLTGNELIRAKLQAALALPAYRKTPDYEALIQGHRLMTVGEHSQSMGNLGLGQGTHGQIDGVVYAQPQFRQQNYTPQELKQRQQYRVSYGGMPSNYMSGNYLDTSSESLQHPYVGQVGYNSNQMVHTYSVPELTSEQIQTMDYIAEKLRKNKTKPPPPYPRGSTSTPDLARQSMQSHLVSASSPDLVSQRFRALLHQHVPEVLGSAGSNMISSVSSSSGNADLSHSLPMEAFQNMRISSEMPQHQDYNNAQGMGGRYASQQQVQMQHQQPHQQHGAEVTTTDIPILQAPMGYDEGAVILRDRAYSMGSKPMNDYHVPLVRPPSEFADTSDIDSNISPNSVGSPPRQFRLPGHGQDMYINTQAPVPENAIITYAANYGNDPSLQHSPPGHKYPYKMHIPQNSAPSSPEMREINANQYTMMHLDQVGIRQPFQIPRTAAVSEPILTMLPNHHPTNNNKPSIVSNPHSTVPNLSDLHLSGQASYNSDSMSMPSTSSKSPQSPGQSSSSPEYLAKRISSGYSTSPDSDVDVSKQETESKGKEKKEEYIGPLKLAAMSGLTLMRPGKVQGEEEENPKHPRDARRKVLDQQLKEGQVFTEYEQIFKKRPDAIFYTAKLPENAPRNRFPDVLPYEDTRIELTALHDNKTGYINASLLKIPIAKELFQYVAAQAPMESTVVDWWRMVWEKGIHVIAMLTKLEENGKEKCFRYWPQCNSKKNTVEFGPFRVIGQFCNDSGNYITSGLTVRHVPSGEQRTVWHLQYNDWPNQGCPDDVQGYLAFIEEFQSVWRHANSMNEDDKPSPPLIHCSAGVGRTGVLVLTDIMINSLEHNEEINIPRMLQLVRRQRMLMVQTIGQYTFVYKALIQFLRNTRLI